MNESIFPFIIKSVLSLFVFLFLYWLVLRNEKIFQFNRFYLILTPIISSFISIIDIYDFFNKETPSAVIDFANSNVLTSVINSTALVEGSQTFAQNFNEVPFTDILMMLYFIISAFLLIKLIYGFIRMVSLVLKNPIQKKLDYTIVFMKENYSPFSFCKYIFINESIKDNAVLQRIIDHEKEHNKHFHSIDSMLIEFITVMLWFNPFIWLIRKYLKEIHEFQVDEKVIAQGFDSVSYSTFLLNQIVGAKAMDFANCFNQSLIKKRIIMMKKINPGKMANIKKIVVIPMAILLLAFIIVQSNQGFAGGEADSFELIISGDGKIPKNWFKAGMNSDEYYITIDNEMKKDGKASVLITSKNPTEKNAFGNLMQIISAENYLGKRLKFSAYIKTENAENGAAIWMRVDGGKSGKDENIQSLSFDNMYNRQPTGTSAWKKYEIVLDVPKEAVTINYGMMLYQKGKAWFADLNIEEVSYNIPITDMKSQHSFPKNPQNLNFQE